MIQKFKKVNGINKAICLKCNKLINYPEGVIIKDLFLGIIEIHKTCIRKIKSEVI